jgi:lipoyl-dependent peroxiredoxin
MALAERSATVVWEGGLAQGKGLLDMKSGAAEALPISWPARTERSDGKTSPEELIAAAHAGCFAMALSHALGSAGHTPERLEIQAVCAIEKKSEGGIRISTMRLAVKAKIPGADEAAFRTGLEGAEQGCPVSNALRNNVDIQVTGELET